MKVTFELDPLDHSTNDGTLFRQIGRMIENSGAAWDLSNNIRSFLKYGEHDDDDKAWRARAEELLGFCRQHLEYFAGEEVDDLPLG